MTITTLVSPSLNGLGDDRPLGLALQVDDGTRQTNYFVPAATPGSLPSAWGGQDGWVAKSIIEVPMVFSVQPGAHTLKVCEAIYGGRAAVVDVYLLAAMDDRADGRCAEDHYWCVAHSPFCLSTEYVY